MQRRAEELEDFKSRINLNEYAAACGYRLDRKASCRNSAVMVRSPGDKINIALGSDRHWIYFSVGEERDSGSIIDFVQNRQGGALGEVRKQLRPWLEGRLSDLSRPPPDAFLSTLEPASKDLIAVRARYEAMKPINGSHPYLRMSVASPPRCSAIRALQAGFASTATRMQSFPTGTRTGFAATR